MAKDKAVRGLTLPEASGLCFFCGCFLSFSISAKSLIIYIVAEASMKEINAFNTAIRLKMSVNFKEKTIATKTK